MTPATEPFWTGLLELPADRGDHDHPLVGARTVRDTDLPGVVRDAGPPVSVVVTGGAGQVAGPAEFCTRTGLALAGLTVALRDLDDLAGNARRVIAAVDAARGSGSLDEETPVHVELPAAEASYGWLAAADEVAGAELLLGLRLDAAPAPVVAAWLDAALDRETPFRAATEAVVPALAATGLAFDGAARDEVVAALGGRHDAGPDDLARGRRWVARVAVDSLDATLSALRLT